MDIDDDISRSIPPEKDFGSIPFEDPGWINTHKLTEHNVLEYFSLSPFWETSYNLNLLMRTQLIHNDPQTVTSFLQRSKGYYYKVSAVPSMDSEHPSKPIWLISKQYCFGVDGDGETKTIGIYYVCDNKIMQAPYWNPIVGSRLWQAAEACKTAATELWNNRDESITVQKDVPLTSRVLEDQHRSVMESAFDTLNAQFPTLAKRISSLYQPQMPNQ